MSQSTVCYRVVFTSEGKTQELFAKYISEESLIGFVEVEELLLTAPRSGLVVDTQEERLQQTFKGVKRTYLPLHTIIRIDEMERQVAQPQGLVSVEDKSTVSYLSKTPQVEVSDSHPVGGE